MADGGVEKLIYRLAELDPLVEDFDGYYLNLCERYPDIELRFSDTLKRPLPKYPDLLRRVLARTYEALAMTDPEAADTKLALQYRAGEDGGWSIPIADTSGKDWRPSEFTRDKGGPDEATFTDLVWLLTMIESDWLAHRRALWISLRTAEQLAIQYLDLHLLNSEDRLEEVTDAYIADPSLIGTPALAKGGGNIFAPLAKTLKDRPRRRRFKSLEQAILRLSEKRRSLDQAELGFQSSVLSSVAMAASLVPVAVAASISPDAPEAIKSLREGAGDAASRAQAARLAYLAEMRREAAAHPVLVVMHDLSRKDNFGDSDVFRRLIEAIEDVGAAIQQLTAASAEPVIPPGLREIDGRDIAPGAEAMTLAVKEAGKLSVWKLPFFLDRALRLMLEEERPAVLGLRENAFDRANDSLLVQQLVLDIVDSLVILLTPFPAAEIALSLAVGLARLDQSLQAYEEIKTLYNGSLDPAFMLLGDGADEAPDATMIVVDVAGLMLDAAGVGQLVKR